MSNSAQRHRKPTRKEKSHQCKELVPTTKYVDESIAKLERFVPTQSQRVLVNKIRQNTVTFVDAHAGTGKSSTILYYFCQEYLKDKSKKILVIRTPVEAGQDKIGFLPSDKDEKLAPHFASTKKILCDFLGKGKVEADTNNRIFFDVPNFQLGNTWDGDFLVLIDEAQQLQPLIMKLLLERIGAGCKVVVAGCSSQIYSGDKNRNALADAIYRFFDEQGNPLFDEFALHKFGIEDVMRDDVVKSVIMAYGG